MNTKQMAQALVDLHNCLPYGSQDKYNEMPEDAEPLEYVQELYENLLTELWEIANRFPPDSLEAVLKSADEAKPLDTADTARRGDRRRSANE